VRRRFVPIIGLSLILAVGFIFGVWLINRSLSNPDLSGIRTVHVHATAESMPGMDMAVIQMPVVTRARPLSGLLVGFASLNSVVLLLAISISWRKRVVNKLRQSPTISAPSQARTVS
jgi:hypothetical protein